MFSAKKRAKELLYKKITNEFSFVLGQSRIQGIGVFVTHPIEKGTRLRLFAGEKSRFLKSFPIDKESNYHHYCIKSPGGWHCPSDFGKMAIGWYLNHSNKPNIFHKRYTYFAKRNIEAGEELTVDYQTL